MDENQNGTVCGSRTAADALRRLDANANYLHAFSYLRHLLGSGVISKEQADTANRYYADYFNADIVLVL